MCGRYRPTRADRLAEKFEAVYGGDDLDLTPHYNIAPTQPVLVVRANHGRRVISSMRWGLIPSWAKDTSAAQINARSETLFEKPAFRFASTEIVDGGEQCPDLFLTCPVGDNEKQLRSWKPRSCWLIDTGRESCWRGLAAKTK